MPRQRSKKLSESRKAEDISRKATALDSDHESVHSESESENPSIASKDDEEEELDRLVLGDGAGFKAQLAYDYSAGHNEGDGEVDEEDEEAEGGLENVDDADVRKTPPFVTTSAYISLSFSFLMRDHLQLTRLR
jgi:U3 small nucleolar RNA-associated protein 18